MTPEEQIENAITTIAILEVELRTVNKRCSEILHDALIDLEWALDEVREEE
jgi:hypothetical protein